MNGGAGRDRIGNAAFGFHILQCGFPALADSDVEARIDKLDLGTHHTAQQDIAHAVIHRVGEWSPAFLNEPAFHAELGSDRGDLPRMVRLDAADGDQGVSSGGQRVGNDVFELTDLVTAKRQA